MAIDTTLRMLIKASGMSMAEIATAIPRAGVTTVSAWLKGEKVPGRDQLDALARILGVPAGALFSELANTFDPRNRDEHQLLAAYRTLPATQKAALLEIAAGLAGKQHAAAKKPAKQATIK